MSTTTPPPLPHDPNLNNHQPDAPVPLSSPVDPLLKSGSSLNANSPTPTVTAASTTSNAQTPKKKSPKHVTSNGSESQSTPSKPPPETLKWLPSSWIVEDRVRTSGATAGVVDRYYIDPASGRRFRSKKEVLYFLETGTPRKKKKGAENSDADVDSLGSHVSNKQKSGKKGKTEPAPTPTPLPTPAPAPAPLNFDYWNAPEKIQWVLTKTSEDSWTPLIGKDKVPENTLREWAVAFTFLSTSKHGNRMS